jgi:uncharacterized membrane protein YgcG
MDLFQETAGGSQPRTFLSHVFLSTEEGKAEILNIIQYAFMGIIPIVILNKLIQRFIPEADPENSTLELLVEIFIQIIVMFCGIILIHRMITYFPTYSGFKYENLTLTNIVLAFLIIVLSIQTKLGIKVNIIYEKLVDLWNGTTGGERKTKVKKGLRVSQNMNTHTSSQADYLDNSSVQTTVFPPAPVSGGGGGGGGGGDSHNYMMGGSGGGGGDYSIMQPMAANSLLGSSFGSSF